MEQKEHLDQIILESNINEAGVSRRDFLRMAGTGIVGAVAFGADYSPTQGQEILVPSKPADSQSGLESKVVNKPDLRVGDTWVLYFTYNGQTDTRTIKDIKNGLVYLTRQYPNDCGRETFVYTREWGLVEGCSLPIFSSSRKISLDPPEIHMPFTVREGNTVRPLRAGDNWELPYKVYGAGQPIENWIKGKALGWETIQVPAGTFEALKIEDGRVAGGIQPKFFVWWSNEANNFIKFTDPSRPHLDYELQSYKRA